MRFVINLQGPRIFEQIFYQKSFISFQFARFTIYLRAGYSEPGYHREIPPFLSSNQPFRVLSSSSSFWVLSAGKIPRILRRNSSRYSSLIKLDKYCIRHLYAWNLSYEFSMTREGRLRQGVEEEKHDEKEEEEKKRRKIEWKNITRANLIFLGPATRGDKTEGKMNTRGQEK